MQSKAYQHLAPHEKHRVEQLNEEEEQLRNRLHRLLEWKKRNAREQEKAKQSRLKYRKAWQSRLRQKQVRPFTFLYFASFIPFVGFLTFS